MDNADRLLTHQLVERQVARTPEAIAVVAGHRRTTYRDLDALANGVAHRLVAEQVEPGALVGVCMHRDERLIAALLGVFKAGAAYVPLDPAYPADRLAFISEDASLSHVVVSKEHHDLAVAMGTRPLLIDEVAPAPAPPTVRLPADALSYVVYTSGSTGRPKGVVVEHAGTANFVRWAVSILDAQEMAGSLAALSVCFDGSILEIFPPLVTGGTVIVAESLLDLPNLPARDEVTMMVPTPSAVRVLLHSGLPASVRLVIPVGEALPTALVQALFAQPGVARVCNGYGPTEITTLSHCHDMRRESFVGTGDYVPIGRPVAGAEPHVLDPQGREVPDGEVGELWIAGPGVTRGYLNRPDLTAERFVADPAVAGGRRYGTGDLVRRTGDEYSYLGRIDDQVKIRGFRVELGEVEAVLASHPDVGGAVAIAPADEFGVRTLFGYVEPLPGAVVSEEELKEYLGRRLPGFLVPTRIGVLDAIPIGPIGKADRSALPPLRPIPSTTDLVAPRTDLEARIAEVFAEVLQLPAIGVHDDFFAVGGHSLGAGLAVARLSEQLGVPVPLAWLLVGPTVADLAARIDAGADDEPRAVRHAGQVTFPLTTMQINQWIALQAAPGCVNTIAYQLRLRGLPSAAVLQVALDAIVARHEVLRTVAVRPADSQWPAAVVHPPAPVPLAEFDVRGSADPEAALARIVAEAAQYRFDVATEVPMIRGTLVWTGQAEAALIMTTDHLVFDGYSIGLFVEELAASTGAAALGEPDPVPEPVLQVGDFAMLQRELGQRPSVPGMRDFWRAELAGANSPNLPGDERTRLPERGIRVVQHLDLDALSRISSLADACGVTRFTVFAAALGVLLHEYTGHPDNLIGAVTALRDRPGLARVLGPLFDVVAVRVRIEDGMTFRQLAAAVSRARSRALANQDLGLGGIMQVAYEGQTIGLSTQLTPVVLSMQPESVPVVVEHGGLRVELTGEIDTGSTSMCDLSFLVNGIADGLEIHLMYDVSRFEHDEVRQVLQQLVVALEDAAADPDRAVAGLVRRPDRVR
jgi:amino acid adenylation domain-containing protein